jgi:hypothetical protein
MISHLMTLLLRISITHHFLAAGASTTAEKGRRQLTLIVAVGNDSFPENYQGNQAIRRKTNPINILWPS